MLHRLSALTVSLVLMAAALVPNVRADEWDKTTIVTLSESVQVPGTVLLAGTYRFKLADSTSDRNIVQIFNEDGTQLITTILTVPDSRLAPTGKTVLKFDERPSGQPEALKAWFYPGDNFGQVFVYPKQKATELAQSNKEAVLSVRDHFKDRDEMRSAPVEPAPPRARVRAVAEETGSAVAVAEETEVVDAPVPAPAELPKTASDLPAIALLGVLCSLAAIGVRRLGA
jgi:hypothetical protein